MLTRIPTVKIDARISAIYLFLSSLFWSWNALAAVLNEAPNFEAKQTFSHAKLFYIRNVAPIFLAI